MKSYLTPNKPLREVYVSPVVTLLDLQLRRYSLRLPAFL